MKASSAMNDCCGIVFGHLMKETFVRFISFKWNLKEIDSAFAKDHPKYPKEK